MGLALRAQGAREAMSVHIVDDEQRSDRGATPMRPSGSGRRGASAAPGTRPLPILGQTPGTTVS